MDWVRKGTLGCGRSTLSAHIKVTHIPEFLFSLSFVTERFCDLLSHLTADTVRLVSSSGSTLASLSRHPEPAYPIGASISRRLTLHSSFHRVGMYFHLHVPRRTGPRESSRKGHRLSHALRIESSWCISHPGQPSPPSHQGSVSYYQICLGRLKRRFSRQLAIASHYRLNTLLKLPPRHLETECVANPTSGSIGDVSYQ